jgi:peptidoglycan/LPS O-acetylase OafA/YrhL
MESLIRFTLIVAAALYLGWGLSLILAPEVTQTLISNGPHDPVTTAMFGAALLGMMIMFIIAAYDPEREIVRASAAALAVIGFTAGYLMFVPRVMPLSLVTLFSLLVNLGACGVLFLSEARLDLRDQGRSRRTGPAARQRHA